jgi:glycosyltransferase involved in cell wall biosynthesis
MVNFSITKIAVIDPSSYSLPYDYFYINELKKNVQVDFYFSKCTSNYDYIEKLRLCENVTLHEYSISPSSTSKIFGVINYFIMLKDIFLNRNSYKHIHFIWSVLFILEILFFLLIKDKLIFTFHNDVPHSYNKTVFWPYKCIQKLASKIVFVSNYTMRTFLNNYGTHPNYKLVQHGIMPIEIEVDTHIDVNVQVEKVVFFWGRIEEYKGVDIFDDFNLEWPIEIYGKWSSQLLSLKHKLSQKNNVHINDSYLPFDELASMLSRNGVFILPYKDASQSGVLYTLLAYGKVFISSNVGENNDFLIEHGLEQLIFERNDKDSLTRALDFAFNEYNEIRLKLLKVKVSFEWDNVLNNKKINELYSS